VRFSIVIPTLGREEILETTLASIRRCEPAPDEVIVIDASSGGSAREVVRALDDDERSLTVRYLQSEPSATRQRNLGIDEATGDVLVFLDDDVTLPPDLFARLAELYRDETIVAATGRVVEPDPWSLASDSRLRRLLPGGGVEGTFTRYGYPRYLVESGEARDVEFMRGCFMSARREAATKVRFDEHLGGYSLGEDEDFSYRLSRLGRVHYAPGIVVEHRKLGFSAQDPQRLARLVVVNRAYLFRKNFDRTLLARTQFGMFVLMLFGHRVVHGEWRGAQGVLEGAVQAWRDGR
jgi:glycosyltransferase involved in cell wall biosynthesis